MGNNTEEKNSKRLTDFSRANLTFCYNKSMWERSDSFDLLKNGTLIRIADALEKTNLSNQELAKMVIENQNYFLKKIDSMNTKISMLKTRIRKLENK